LLIEISNHQSAINQQSTIGNLQFGPGI